ncbi:MAG: hypothetical protein C0444_05920 [Microbacterium sp.]|nr:hypothetical protein [Microbacterium sp.]MBA4345013.1 hypothetical protein [Microbacterium sp.]
MTMRRVRGMIAALIVAATMTSIAGCSPAAPPAPGPSGAAATAAELAVTADVYRTRIDPSRGAIQLSVRNDAEAPLTVVVAALESPALSTPISRERTTVIGPGLTRDLPLTLSPAACPASSTTPPEAVLTVMLADGTSTELRVPTTDRLGQWAEWIEAECFAAAVAQRATLDVEHDASRDDGALIGLRLTADRLDTGLELVSIGDTVLFGLVSGAEGARVTSMPLVVSSDSGGGTGAVSIPLVITPARCDAHALADDKQGTLFVVDVLLDGEPGSVTINANSATRAALYDAYTRACGL